MSLWLNLFDWAKFRTAKGGVKIHTVWDDTPGLPDYINISDARNIFVTHLKSNILYESVGELDLQDDTDQKILKDEQIKFTSKDALKAGLEGQIFRLVTGYKEDENKVIRLITNQMDWQAITIADLYRKC